MVVAIEGACFRNRFAAGIALFAPKKFISGGRLWGVIADGAEEADKAHEIESDGFAGGDAFVNNILRELLEFFPNFRQADGEIEAIVLVARFGVVGSNLSIRLVVRRTFLK